MREMASFTIGRLARSGGIGVETVRFYQREGLLDEPPRPVQGDRTYSGNHLERVLFIRRAREIGFSVAEVRELLSLLDTPDGPSAEVRARVLAKLEDIEARLRDLTAMKTQLQAMAVRCNGQGTRADCSILETLTGGASAAPASECA